MFCRLLRSTVSSMAQFSLKEICQRTQATNLRRVSDLARGWLEIGEDMLGPGESLRVRCKLLGLAR